jgi:tetratricopeptide (TPR) repeat protein
MTRRPVLLFLAAFAIGAHEAPAAPSGSWVEARGPTLSVLSDADPERAREIALELERFRAALQQLAPGLELRSPIPTRLIAFRDDRSLAPYKSAREGKATRLLGQFLSGPDGNFLILNADPVETEALGVGLHELVHEVVRNNFPWAPLWLHEGLAEYYSTFQVQAGHAVVGGLSPRHRRWIVEGGPLDLAEVLGQEPGTFRRDHAGSVTRLYGGAWALTHFLLSTRGSRLGATADYLDLLAQGEDPRSAFERAYEVRLQTLEDEITRYLQEPFLPVAKLPLAGMPALESIAVQPVRGEVVRVVLGDLLLLAGDRGAAREHFHAALTADPRRADALAGLAFGKELSGSLEEADLLYRDALAAGGPGPLTWLRYGRFLLRRLSGDPAAGAEGDERDGLLAAQAAFHRVLDREPWNAAALALLGQSHLHPEADPAAGLRFLEAAYRAMPERLELAFDLVRLQVRADRFDAAQGWIDGVIRRWGSATLLIAAEEEVARGRLLSAAEKAWHAGEHDRALELLEEAIAVTRDEGAADRLERRWEQLRARVPGASP